MPVSPPSSRASLAEGPATRTPVIDRLARWHPLLLLLGCCIAATALCTWFYSREAKHAEAVLRERETVRVGAFGHQLTENFASKAARLRTLAASQTLGEFLEHGGREYLDRFARDAWVLHLHHDDIDQISYIDNNGREQMRVDNDEGILPATAMRDRANLPLFQEALHLQPGEVRRSRIDLDEENGIVTTPWKPRLRFAAAVFDDQGERRGVIIINFLAQQLVEHFANFYPVYSHRLRLLNDKGYWLRTANPADEWGFVFADRNDRTLARQAPALWRRVSTEAQGQARYNGGLLTWRRFDPASTAADTRPGGASFLLVGSEVSADEWTATFAQLRQTFTLVGAALLIVTLAITWLYQRQRREAERRRETDELNAAILHSAGAGVITLDASGTVRSLNVTAQRLLGWDAAEIVGRKNASVLYDRDAMKAFARETGAAMNRHFRHGLEALAAKVLAADGPIEREWI
ncbi:MAG TPA: PAS domain-containing protein, partial [Opitutus sp.]|nr:PAS domain-containing protein [Opitutus sp.]